MASFSSARRPSEPPAVAPQGSRRSDHGPLGPSRPYPRPHSGVHRKFLPGVGSACGWAWEMAGSPGAESCSVWCGLSLVPPYNHPSAGTLCIPPSPLSLCLFVRCYDAQTFGTCSWYSIFIFIFLSLQVEYSRSGSKMWASQRALSNFTEIKNLLVNTQYTVRVSVRTRFSRLAGWPGNMGRWLHFHENSMPSLTRCWLVVCSIPRPLLWELVFF